MNTFRLITRSLAFYWRTNLAVLLGVVAATAVISGALIVGDSVRGSLRQMSLDRLGNIDHALVSYRFFRENLADDLAGIPEFQQRFETVAPALVMTGGLIYQAADSDLTTRAGGVNVYGIDARAWDLLDHGDVPSPQIDEVILSALAARQLGVQAGDEISLWIELPASIPRESLLGEREESSREIPLTVQAVLEESLGAGRLALQPNQQEPASAFLALETMQTAIDLQYLPRSRRNPVERPARVNALFVSARNAADQTDETEAADAANLLNEFLGSPGVLALADFSLRLRENTDRNYLSLESDQMILEDPLVGAARSAATQQNLASSPVYMYLANEIANANDSSRFSMYSIVAGLDVESLAEPPFGPFKFLQGPLDTPPQDNEVILNEWLQQDLQVDVGDQIRMTYHVVGSHGELPEEERLFTVRGVLQLIDTPAADENLTPELKGITDADTFGDWEQPFPMDLDRVTDRDEEYWDLYGPTPKTFVTLAAAQELWPSRFGSLTSFRVAPAEGHSLEEARNEFEQAFLAAIPPEDLGLGFTPIKMFGLRAASGTTDFTGLFIGFSFFLILSAIILINLLFRLGVEQRGRNIGLVTAVGFAPNQVRSLFLREGVIVVVSGALVGLAAAVGYASLMVYGLKTWWIGAIGTKYLFVSVGPVSLLAGFFISVLVAVGAAWWGLRVMRAISARDLLAGVTEQPLTSEGRQSRGRKATRLGTVCVVVAALLVIGAVTGLIPSSEAFSGFSWQVVAFFLVGTATLTASLAFLSAWLDTNRESAVGKGTVFDSRRLSVRNAARHRQRSVLSTGLIASASFVIVAIAAAQRNPAVESPQKESGNGGYLLVAESSQPVLYDLNTEDGRNQLNFNVDESSPNAQLLSDMSVMSFRVKPGEDASCLNLYQTRLPTILGVPQSLIERSGFKFADTKGDNPWTLLNETGPNGEIPVLGDMNTLMYSLHKGIGKTISVPDEDHPDYVLQIAGMFDGSVFQGVLLMSEENFRKLYPEVAGYEYFLVAVPPERTATLTATRETAKALSDLLETQLADKGFDAEPVAERLARFLAVQNTYLSTFQTLGGLGLLLGTIGLATVMLRNVLERRSELALLRAVGFRNVKLAWLVLWENALLLTWGLVAGAISALLAMLPHLLSTGADVPWGQGGLILGGVFVVGMTSSLLAVAQAVRTPILSTLRSE